MMPESCKNDIMRIITEQQPSRILFVSDNSVYSNDLFQFLSCKYQGYLHCYADEDIVDLWDMIIISSLYLTSNESFLSILRDLLQYTKQSMLVTSAVYWDKDGRATDWNGIRYIHPVKFAEFDFSFKTYRDPVPWETYNFYPNDVHEKSDVLLTSKIPNSKNHKLNVLYVLPHLNLTGGIKCMLTHARNLYYRGHNVYLLYDGKTSAVPEWSDLLEGKDFSGQFFFSDGSELLTQIYNKKIDVIVLGFYPQISIFKTLDIPVVYWEQGHELLFGEFSELQSCTAPIRKHLREIYQSPVTIAANSTLMASILRARFGRSAPLLYTGIDTDLYYPLSKELISSDIPKVLLVGNPNISLKNFGPLLYALEIVWKLGYRFQVTWACQIPVNLSVSFPLEVKVQVPQTELARLYREHDIYINSSLYEAFGMPPLEAMASGCAVIATDSGGIRTYAKSGENMLMAEQGKLSELMVAIIYLLEHPEMRSVLGENGRKTALEFGLDQVMEQLERVLFFAIDEHSSFVK